MRTVPVSQFAKGECCYAPKVKMDRRDGTWRKGYCGRTLVDFAVLAHGLDDVGNVGAECSLAKARWRSKFLRYSNPVLCLEQHGIPREARSPVAQSKRDSA